MTQAPSTHGAIGRKSGLEATRRTPDRVGDNSAQNRRSDVDPYLVIGIGNVLLRDEGAGVHAARRLAERVGDRRGLRILDGGTLGMALAPAIAASESLIVFDAAEFHVEPGRVMCLIGADMDRHLGRGRSSVHEVGLLDLMDIARLSGTLPGRRALIAVQVEDVDWGDELSAAVERGVATAVDRAVELLDTWRGATEVETSRHSSASCVTWGSAR